MIDLYGCGSPNVLKILLMLEETELPYRLHAVNVHAGEQFREEFLALNPNAKVPVIVDHDMTSGPHAVFESGAILYYLAEKTGRFLGHTHVERSACMQWLTWQVAGVGPMFGQALHFQFVAPDGNEYARRRYLTEVKRLYDVAERRLAQSQWLAGDDYTIADMAAWPWLRQILPLSRNRTAARFLTDIFHAGYGPWKSALLTGAFTQRSRTCSRPGWTRSAQPAQTCSIVFSGAVVISVPEALLHQ